MFDRELWWAVSNLVAYLVLGAGSLAVLLLS